MAEVGAHKPPLYKALSGLKPKQSGSALTPKHTEENEAGTSSGRYSIFDLSHVGLLKKGHLVMINTQPI